MLQPLESKLFGYQKIELFQNFKSNSTDKCKWMKKNLIGFIFESMIKCHKAKRQQRPGLRKQLVQAEIYITV